MPCHGERDLLAGATTVLVQCNERQAAFHAATAALDWLHSVLAVNERLDPVVALHQHQRGLAVAWSRYSSWQTVVPRRIESPDLVNLLLDRHSQRAAVLQAKEDFYTATIRRIYHAAAFGIAGCRVAEFPSMVNQHLRIHKREQEVFLHHSFSITTRLDTARDVDALVRQQLRLTPQQSIIGALLPQGPVRSRDFWFLILGWVLPQPLDDTDTGVTLIRAIAEWGSTLLFQELSTREQEANIRVLSIVALETSSETVAEALEDAIADLAEDLDNAEHFHIGELERLAGVRRRDLRNYFQDRQFCNCDDRYRPEFPQLLLGERREMPFDEAVATIRRGYPDNWGNLFEELRDLTAAGDWPPAPGEPAFWESSDGR